METTSGDGAAARAALDAIRQADRRSFEAGREPLWLMLAYVPLVAVATALYTARFEGVELARLVPIAAFLVLTLWLRRRMGVGRVKRRFAISKPVILLGAVAIAAPMGAIFIVFLVLRDVWADAWLVHGLCQGGFMAIVVLVYRRWETRRFERWLAAHS